MFDLQDNRKKKMLLEAFQLIAKKGRTGESLSPDENLELGRLLNALQMTEANVLDASEKILMRQSPGS